jgi:hypothetical protein
MRRIAISVVCACVASSALADDAGRGRASNGSHQTASADMSTLESAARISVWPMVGAMLKKILPLTVEEHLEVQDEVLHRLLDHVELRSA